jgi:hypothetical protein
MAAQPFQRFRSALRRAGRLLPLVLACAAAAPALAGEQDFRRAVESYRTGRLSDAYGRFLALAYEGDADAARIVLFLGQYGPLLHGKQWELTEDDAAFLKPLAGQRSAHLPPAVEPVGFDATGSRYAPRPQPAAGR